MTGRLATLTARLIFCTALFVAGGLPVSLLASLAEVRSQQKISAGEGGFTDTLAPSDRFGRSVAALGDLDGDGVVDLAVGARDQGNTNRGAVWILFLESDGTVKSQQKISATEGNFGGVLDFGDIFGGSLASIGDLDRDGVVDLAVGAFQDDDGGSRRGAVWILFLKPDGTVKSEQKISDTEGNFTGTLNDDDLFGSAVASLDDFDGDGIVDLAVGAPQETTFPDFPGAVWLLFLNLDGTVKSHVKIDDTQIPVSGNSFGRSVASPGDINGDGVRDLAVGGGGFLSVWILFLDADGTPIAQVEIEDTEPISDATGALGDFDGDGVGDLIFGSPFVDDGGMWRGAAWNVFLNPDGSEKSRQRISDSEGNFTGELDDGDFFGRSVVSLGDVDGDGVDDLAVGASGDDDGFLNAGAVWLLFLDGCGNGTLDAGEQCEDGNTFDGDGCDSNCTVTGCGNGIVSGAEQCDDGNADECDGCLADCTITGFCGDGFTDPVCGEQCDDGNSASGDGCENDCTPTRSGVLYDQTASPGGLGAPDQKFELNYSVYDSEGADDFEVGSPVGWDVQRVITLGESTASSIHVDLKFYPDLGGLPSNTPVCEYSKITTYSDVEGDLSITLPQPCSLAPGHYWVAQQVRQDFNGFEFRRWSASTAQSGSEAVWRNPLDEFGTGCLDWTPKSLCLGESPDFLFQLVGEVTEGDPVPALGPFGLLAIVVGVGSGFGYILTRRGRAS